MKIFIILSCLVVVSLATPTTFDLHSKWAQFKLTHSKTYENLEEEQKRFEIFNDKLQQIDEHNKLYEQGLVSYKKAINQFTDWTHEEFMSFLGKPKQPKLDYVGTFARPLNVQLPTAIDWRDKGVVASVRNQANCAYPWAFVTAALLESHQAIKTGTLKSLSVQELADCSTSGEGCSGGSQERAFNYARQHGLMTDEQYPFVNLEDHCHRGYKPAAVRATAYNNIDTGNATDLQAAVATIGPVAVAVNSKGWSDYAGGIFAQDVQSLDPANHAALIVGYGTDNKNGGDYWIVKNSWGTLWGEDGYIRLSRREDYSGIYDQASYPIL